MSRHSSSDVSTIDVDIDNINNEPVPEALPVLRGNDDDADTVTMDTPEKGPQKKKRRLCNYNKDWEKQYDWVASCLGDTTKAKCTVCSVTFTVAHDGVDAVKSHATSKKHGQCVQTLASSRRMHTFFCVAGTPQSDKVTGRTNPRLSWRETSLLLSATGLRSKSA